MFIYIYGANIPKVPHNVVQYFDAIHVGLSGFCHCRSNITFSEHTANRQESVNRQLKAVLRLAKWQLLTQFLKDLTATIAVILHERQQTVVMSTVNSYPSDSMHAQFLSALTPFVANISLKQLRLAEQMSDEELPDDVTSSSCYCASTVRLPCHHVLLCQQRNEELPFLAPLDEIRVSAQQLISRLH